MRAGNLSLPLAFRLRHPARLQALPARLEPEPAAPAGNPLPLRPAVDLETRLMLRDLGWQA